MPTINQLVRKGRKSKGGQSQNLPHCKWDTIAFKKDHSDKALRKNVESVRV